MEMIVVRSKVKEVVKSCNVAGEFADALNKVAIDEVKKAAKRAEANGRKTVQSKDVFVGKMAAKVSLVVKSKVKDVLAGKFNVSGDFADALNEVLIWYIMQAEARALANNRKTVSAKDL